MVSLPSIIICPWMNLEDSQIRASMLTRWYLCYHLLKCIYSGAPWHLRVPWHCGVPLYRKSLTPAFPSFQSSGLFSNPKVPSHHQSPKCCSPISILTFHLLQSWSHPPSESQLSGPHEWFQHLCIQPRQSPTQCAWHRIHIFLLTFSRILFLMLFTIHLVNVIFWSILLFRQQFLEITSYISRPLLSSS